MSDEKFEEFLQREAAAYNEPPAMAPRDEMWASITEARAARRSSVTAPMMVVTPVHGDRSRRPMLRYAPWIGMAATLLLGVGIGRFLLQRDAVTSGATGPLVAATSSAVSPLVSPLDSPAVSGANDSSAPGAQRAGDRQGPVDAVPSPRQLPAASSPTRVASNMTNRNSGVVPMATNGDANGAAPQTPYGVVSQRHLASAEALISVVTSAPRDAMLDSLTSKWAREMLSNTRLLLDSPAGDEPLRRRLLEDLETLLVQLVQRSGGAVDERDLIDRTLQRTQLLTRLRTNATGT